MRDPLLIDLPTRLDTERLLMRPPQAGDGPQFFEALSESLVEMRRFLGSLTWVAAEPSLENAELHCRNAHAKFVSRADLPFFLFERTTGRFVGATGLHRTAWATPKTEVGYWIRSSRAGRGLIAEAVEAVTQYAFAHIGAVRVELITDAANAASRRVADRCGFVLEGTLANDHRAPDGRLSPAKAGDNRAHDNPREPAPRLSTDYRFSAASAYRLVVVTVLGFASGLPLALTGQAMQAWLSTSGVDIATIGFLSLVGLPYTFKFLWAPLMDRFELPGLGRRRGWLVLTQLLLAAALWWMAATSPTESTRAFALIGVLVAFISASQDIVIDAYRTNLLRPNERGLGSSSLVMGYRLAMILSGGVAFIWVDPSQPGAWSWPEVYRFMAALMVGAAVLSSFALPKLKHVELPTSVARRDVLGFIAVLAAVAIGVTATNRFGRPLADLLLGPLLGATTLSKPLQGKWLDLVALLLGIGFTLPLAAWAARAARFETLLGSLRSYFAQTGAAGFLGLIVFYKLGDAFSLSLVTPFLLQAMHFSIAEVGVVNKVIGLWLTIAGALLGGALMLRIGLWRALMYFGIFQMLGVLTFWWLAVNGRGALPGLTIPAFDWGFVKLAQATPVDGGLLFAVAAENLSGGMGTAALAAFLMSLCNQRYTATQYALLISIASIGRVWVGPLAGVLAESIGWPAFFIVSTFMALPALVMLWWMRREVRALEYDSSAPVADD